MKNNNELAKNVDKLKNAVVGLLVVYGPASEEKISEDIDYYFPGLADFSHKYLKDLLEGIYTAQIIDKSKKEYSSIPFKNIKVIEKALSYREILPVGDKEFTGKEIAVYGSDETMIKGHEFKELKKYLDTVITDKDKLRKVEGELVFFPYLFVDEGAAIDLIKENTTKQIDEEEVKKAYSNYFSLVPRYFFGGYSFSEYNEELKKSFSDFYGEKEDNLIKKYPAKKDYPVFSYKDLIELGKKIANAKIYRLIDSDRILELTINNKKVYTQILGFHHRDIGIIIYKNKEELLYSMHFLLSEENEYPDIAFRFSNIEVCLNDPGGFASDKVLGEMKRNKYPEHPSFIRLEANHEHRLVNDEEIQIVGGVLSDLLTYIKTNNLSDISQHLGEKTDDSFDIDQVYITEKETIYGGYNDDDLDTVVLNFENGTIDASKVKKLKKFKKKDISIGSYIYPSIIENDELAYVTFIRDNQTGMIIDMFLKRVDEMPNLKNDLLDILYKHGICPKNITVSNVYTFEIFDEFIDYFEDYDFCEDKELDEIYNEALNFELSESEKVDRKNFS